MALYRPAWVKCHGRQLPNAPNRAIIIAVFDDFPPQFWLLLALVIAAVAPVRYIVRHLAHDPRRRDITLPPEDLSWRSTALLVRCLVAVAVLAGIAAFSLTPSGESWARSAGFATIAASLAALYALHTVWRGFTAGWIEPMTRGASWTFTRAEQPRRFWASMAWNGALGCLMLWLAASLGQPDTPLGCLTIADADGARSALPDCNALVADADSTAARAIAHGARGRAHQHLGNRVEALADYSAAIRLDPQDADSLQNRATVLQMLDRPAEAQADLTRAIELRPDRPDPWAARADLLLAAGDFAGARDDYSRAIGLAGWNGWLLAGRATALEWLNEAGAAQADWQRVVTIEPGRSLVGRKWEVPELPPAALPPAIARLSTRLAADADDEWALFMRGHLYWQAGQADLARNDDDQLWQLRQRNGTAPEAMVIPVP